MSSVSGAIGCLLVNVLCAAVSLPLFLFLAPQVKETRSEARRIQAHDEAVRLSKLRMGEAIPDWFEVPEVDPWGNPYRITRLADDRVRVESAGDDGAFLPDGAADDIASDMPVSPGEAQRAEKNRQWLIAFGSAGLLWLLVLASVRRRRRSPANAHACV